MLSHNLQDSELEMSSQYKEWVCVDLPVDNFVLYHNDMI